MNPLDNLIFSMLLNLLFLKKMIPGLVPTISQHHPKRTLTNLVGRQFEEECRAKKSGVQRDHKPNSTSVTEAAPGPKCGICHEGQGDVKISLLSSEEKETIKLRRKIAGKEEILGT